jgi:hypothetical protein
MSNSYSLGERLRQRFKLLLRLGLKREQCPPYVSAEEVIEVDPDDTPIEEVKSSLRRALQEAKSGQRIPIAQMWESIDLPPQTNG